MHIHARTSLHDLTRSPHKFPDVLIVMSHATEMYEGCFPFFSLELIFYDVSEGGQQLCWWWKSLLPALAKQEIKREKKSPISALISACAAAVPDSKTPLKGFDLDQAVFFLFFLICRKLCSSTLNRSPHQCQYLPTGQQTDWLKAPLPISSSFLFFSPTPTTQTDLFHTGKEKKGKCPSHPDLTDPWR